MKTVSQQRLYNHYEVSLCNHYIKFKTQLCGSDICLHWNIPKFPSNKLHGQLI